MIKKKKIDKFFNKINKKKKMYKYKIKYNNLNLKKKNFKKKKFLNLKYFKNNKSLINIQWAYLYKKRFLINQKFNKYKKQYSFFSLKKKKKIMFLFLNLFKNINKTNFVLKYKYFKKFCFINYIGRQKNIHLNFSNFLGNVLLSFSGGMFLKGPLKKSYYAISAMLIQSSLKQYKNKLNLSVGEKINKYIINIWSRFRDFKLKKNFFNFIKKNKKNFKKILILNLFKLRAHNGVRLKKLPRK